MVGTRGQVCRRRFALCCRGNIEISVTVNKRKTACGEKFPVCNKAWVFPALQFKFLSRGTPISLKIYNNNKVLGRLIWISCQLKHLLVQNTELRLKGAIFSCWTLSVVVMLTYILFSFKGSWLNWGFLESLTWLRQEGGFVRRSYYLCLEVLSIHKGNLENKTRRPFPWTTEKNIAQCSIKRDST